MPSYAIDQRHVLYTPLRVTETPQGACFAHARTDAPESHRDRRPSPWYRTLPFRVRSLADNEPDLEAPSRSMPVKSNSKLEKNLTQWGLDPARGRVVPSGESAVWHSGWQAPVTRRAVPVALA